MNDQRYVVRHEPAAMRFALVDRGDSGADDGNIDGNGTGGGATADTVIGEERYLDLRVLADGALVPGAADSHEEGADAAPDGGNDRIMFHTEVDEAYSGQGLASKLVGVAVIETIAAGYRVVPVCPYVASWLRKHPEHSDHVVAPTAAHLQAVRDRH